MKLLYNAPFSPHKKLVLTSPEVYRYLPTRCRYGEAGKITGKIQKPRCQVDGLPPARMPKAGTLMQEFEIGLCSTKFVSGFSKLVISGGTRWGGWFAFVGGWSCCWWTGCWACTKCVNNGTGGLRKNCANAILTRWLVNWVAWDVWDDTVSCRMAMRTDLLDFWKVQRARLQVIIKTNVPRYQPTYLRLVR